MKYDISIDSQLFSPDKLDGIKWDDLHYPLNLTEVERAEIDKLINEQIRDKEMLGSSVSFDKDGHHLTGTYNSILDQINVDRQIEAIKKSGRPGLLWFIRVSRIKQNKG